MLCTIPHGLEFNITNQFWKHSPCTLQPCRKACPTSSLWFIFSSTPGSPHPSGFKLDPLPDPNPRTSLHLSLPPPNGKKIQLVFLFCVSPPLLEWLAGYVMLSGTVVLSGFMGCIKVHSQDHSVVSHSACPVHLCLWTWLLSCMVYLDIEPEWSFRGQLRRISFLCLSVQIVDLIVCLPLTFNLPPLFFPNKSLVYCNVLDFNLWCWPAFVLDVNLKESGGIWWLIKKEIEVCRQGDKSHDDTV